MAGLGADQVALATSATRFAPRPCLFSHCSRVVAHVCKQSVNSANKPVRCPADTCRDAVISACGAAWNMRQQRMDQLELGSRIGPHAGSLSSRWSAAGAA